jgi:hypothetical protein
MPLKFTVFNDKVRARAGEVWAIVFHPMISARSEASSKMLIY